MNPILRVAIVGCGKIADSHAAQIQRIDGCEIVAACDREELMAKQLAERFAIRRVFTDVETLLQEARLDIVHITTPPQSHFEIAQSCLERGCHVYVEKPFTLDTAEAQALIDVAQRRRLKITVGHDDQFRHVARRLRQLVKSGYLGGPPVHMESYYCYPMSDTGNYAKALLADKNHWVRRLPGQLFHNVISHGIARIAEYLTSESPVVFARGFVSPMLRQRGESELLDELRVVICDDEGLTANFTFSSQMRPSLHQFHIYGPKNGLLLDQDNETLIKLSGRRYTSYLEQFVPPLSFARQYAGNFLGNLYKFAANDFHPKAGMKFLIEAFYRSILGRGPLPISYRDILMTSQVMDAIFRQVYQSIDAGLQRSDNFHAAAPFTARH